MFDVSGPINERTSKAHGYELNLQHNFGESGFGVIVNKTWAFADAEYDPNTAYQTEETAAGTTLVPVEQFALSGLSDSANFIGFFDKNGVNVRIAYNWRDDFFGGIGQDQGSRSLNPNHTQEYGQWDISASYEINDDLTIFMDGININEEYFKTYGRVKSQPLVMGQTGARYNLGLRYTF
jgi:TonB-dependent receptor